MPLTIDQAQALAMLWSNAGNLNNMRVAAPDAVTDVVFLAVAQEAWNRMLEAAGVAAEHPT